jgi:hypothetical protein
MAINPRRFDSNPWYLRIRRMGGAAYHAWIANDPKAISTKLTKFKSFVDNFPQLNI